MGWASKVRAMAGMALMGLVLAACPGGVTVSDITTVATLTSNDANTPPLRFELTHQPDGSGPRIVSVMGQRLNDYSGGSITSSPVGLSEESYVLQVVSRNGNATNDDPLASDFFKSAGDMAFIRAHVGDLQYLALETPNLNSPTSTTMGQPEGRRDQVSAVFARIGARTLTAPWRLPTDPNCVRLVLPGDNNPSCLHANDLVRMMGGALAGLLINQYDGEHAGADFNVLVRTGDSHVVGYIPTFTPASDSPTRRVRGVVVIYRFDMTIRVLSLPQHGHGPSPVGTPEHHAWVYIPAALLFETGPDGRIVVTGDPFTSGSTEMLNHVAVVISPEVNSGFPGNIANLAAPMLLSHLRGVLAAGPYDGRWAPAAMSTAFNRLAGGATLPADFEVMLAPSPGNVGNGAPHSSEINRDDLGRGVDLLILR